MATELYAAEVQRVGNFVITVERQAHEPRTFRFAQKLHGLTLPANRIILETTRFRTTFEKETP